MSEHVDPSFSIILCRLNTELARIEKSVLRLTQATGSLAHVLSFPLVMIGLSILHENVFQIHKIHANCISIIKYKLLLLS